MSTPAPSQGAIAIVLERDRAQAEEGHTPEHDAGHEDGDLAMAAAAYAIAASGQLRGAVYSGQSFWPWPDGWNPATDPLRTLAKAGELIAAEIDKQLAARQAADPVTATPHPGS